MSVFRFDRKQFINSIAPTAASLQASDITNKVGEAVREEFILSQVPVPVRPDLSNPKDTTDDILRKIGQKIDTKRYQRNLEDLINDPNADDIVFLRQQLVEMEQDLAKKKIDITNRLVKLLTDDAVLQRIIPAKTVTQETQADDQSIDARLNSAAVSRAASQMGRTSTSSEVRGSPSGIGVGLDAPLPMFGDEEEEEEEEEIELGRSRSEEVVAQSREARKESAKVMAMAGGAGGFRPVDPAAHAETSALSMIMRTPFQSLTPPAQMPSAISGSTSSSFAAPHGSSPMSSSQVPGVSVFDTLPWSEPVKAFYKNLPDDIFARIDNLISDYVSSQDPKTPYSKPQVAREDPLKEHEKELVDTLKSIAGNTLDPRDRIIYIDAFIEGLKQGVGALAGFSHPPKSWKTEYKRAYDATFGAGRIYSMKKKTQLLSPKPGVDPSAGMMPSAASTATTTSSVAPPVLSARDIE